MLRPINDKTQKVYSVALPKKVVQNLGKGVLVGGGCLELIDYWPFACHYPRTQGAYMTDIIETEEGIVGYVWDKEFLIAQSMKDKKESPKDFMDCLGKLAEVESLSLYPLSIHLMGALSKDWQALKETYPSCEELPYHDKTTTDVEDGEEIYYKAAMGMAYRWFNRL